MIKIEDKLISDAVIQEKFACDVKACQGACCWEGDFGAPIFEEERTTLDTIYEAVAPYLSEEGRAVIAARGTSYYEEETRDYVTPLLADGACAYLGPDENGIARCGIEQAFEAGKIDYHKPISCHLYPIRIQKLPDYEALNYHEWSICSAACTRGKKEQIRVYEFAKDALVRRYGEDFYTQLEATAAYLIQKPDA